MADNVVLSSPAAATVNDDIDPKEVVLILPPQVAIQSMLIPTLGYPQNNSYSPHPRKSHWY